MLLALALATLLARQDSGFDVHIPLSQVISSEWMLEYNISINGKGPFLTDFDTGANSMDISTDLAKELGVTAGEKTPINGIGKNETSGYFTKLSSVNIGGLDSRDAEAVVVPFPAWIPARCLLGAPLLRAGAIRIDFDRKELEFQDFDHFNPPAKAEKVPLTFGEDARPFIEAKIEGNPCKLFLDTGSVGQLVLNTPFSSRHQLMGRLPNRQHAGQSTFTGRINLLTIRVKALDLGGAQLAGVETDLSLRTQDDTPDADGVIGLRILCRFNLTFDAKHQVLYLEPRANFHDPFVHNRTGLAIDPSNGTLRVDVDPGSPASKAGVKAGDKLVEWNGKPVTVRDVVTIAQACIGPIGSQVSFVVERNGKRLPFEVTLAEVF